MRPERYSVSGAAGKGVRHHRCEGCEDSNHSPGTLEIASIHVEGCRSEFHRKASVVCVDGQTGTSARDFSHLPISAAGADGGRYYPITGFLALIYNRRQPAMGSSINPIETPPFGRRTFNPPAVCHPKTSVASLN